MFGLRPIPFTEFIHFAIIPVPQFEVSSGTAMVYDAIATQIQGKAGNVVEAFE